LLGAGPARFDIPGAAGAAGALDLPLGNVPRLRPPPGATTLLSVPGEAGLALGYARPANAAGGRAVFLSTLPSAAFASADFYSVPAGALEARASFARGILSLAGEAPLVTTDAVREEAHVRRVPSSGALFVFCFSSHEAPGMGVRFRALEALGLDPAARYAVDDVFETDADGRPRRLCEATGATLRDDGVRVPLAALGATVLRIASPAEPVPG
ncbi:MAG TPA: hypothetical protein VHF22_10245, partial [Planctomycetota bacterium]|nr:hypothetical protein [Planctomycetota bacterium]